MIGGIMSMHARKIERKRIKMVRISRKIQKQFYIDILGKEDYEKYIASENGEQGKCTHLN